MHNCFRKGEKRLRHDEAVQNKKSHRAWMRVFWKAEISRLQQAIADGDLRLIPILKADQEYAKRFGV